MRALWTDDLADQIARDGQIPEWRPDPANLIAWIAMCVGCGTAALLIGVLFWVTGR